MCFRLLSPSEIIKKQKEDSDKTVKKIVEFYLKDIEDFLYKNYIPEQLKINDSWIIDLDDRFIKNDPIKKEGLTEYMINIITNKILSAGKESGWKFEHEKRDRPNALGKIIIKHI